jgi:hypothetical protein
MTDETAAAPTSQQPDEPQRPSHILGHRNKGGRPRLRRVGRPPNARIQAERRPPEVEEERLTRNGDGTRLTRRRSRNREPMYVDPKIIPSGVSYEWKAQTVYGMPNPDHMTELRENHWKPVPASRHPHLAQEGNKGHIVRSGCILMERPLYLTEEARQEDWEIAMGEVEKKQRQLRDTPDGTLTRQHESVNKVTRLGRTYEPIPIPKE